MARQVKKQCQLKKFPGKGGWTYAEIPEIPQNPGKPFGWVKVKGSIDNYPLSQYKLMPMGTGQLFLPVKTEIREKIKKEAGDWVEIILEPDESSYEVPEEIIACLEQEPPGIQQRFMALPAGEQKAYIDWIYEAKRDETRVKRIIEMIDNISAGNSFYNRSPSENI
jgi:hypothetical protein